MNIFLTLRLNGRSFPVFLLKDFQQDCQSRDVRFHKKIRRKTFYWKNCMCSILFQKGAKTFGLLTKVFRQFFENCFWCVHNIIMRNFFRKNLRYFLALSHTEQTFSGIQSIIFQHVCQKELSNFFWLWTLSGEVWPFCRKKQRGCQDCSQHVYRNSLKEISSWKKSWVSFLFSEIERKNFGFLSDFVRWGCQMCILRVHKQI